MSRKYTLNNRPASTCINSFYDQTKNVNSRKENDNEGQSKVDSKLSQIKKKYQQCKTQTKPFQKNPTNFFPRYAGNSRQEQVLRKLQNFKSQLQSIPNWENFARSVLFNESESILKQNKIEQYKNPSYQLQKSFKKYQRPKEQSFKISQECEQNKFLLGSNVSFKIKQTSTIQRTGTPIQSQKNGLKYNIQNKTINEFQIEKYKNQSKEKRYEANTINVDRKISQIQRKIKQADIKKKMLGVEFTPFQRKIQHIRQDSSKTKLNKYQFKSRTPDTKFRDDEQKNKQLSYARPPTQPKKTSKMDDFVKSKTRINETFDVVSPRFAHVYQPSTTQSNATQKLNQLSYMNMDKKRNEYNMVVLKDKFEFYPQKRTNNVISEYSNSKTLKQNNSEIEKINWIHAQQYMKERKRRLGEAGSQNKKTKETTTKLVNALCQQVKLDEKFRNSKLWFKAYKNEKKIDRLKGSLSIQGFNLSDVQILQQFNVTEKEDNPFFSVTSQNFDIEDVARSYSQCQKFWRRNIYKKYSRKILQSQDFSCNSIDLDKKNYIILEDLVRFLNMETGTFYRNRDLFTIFKRLSKKNDKINFDDFIGAFCT